MSVGEYCNRETIVVSREDSIREIVMLMRTRHVGDVIVVDKKGEQLIPVGILTDRDIVIEIIAKDVDVDSVTAGDVMSYELVITTEKTKLLDAVTLMRNKGVRRMPVVDEQGGLVGIITVDDVLELIAEQLQGIVSLFLKEQDHEKKLREVS